MLSDKIRIKGEVSIMIEEEKREGIEETREAIKKEGTKAGKAAKQQEDKEANADTAKEKKKDLSEIFTDLDTLLVKMEGEESLEKSFAIYEKAVSLLKEANSSIDRIEKQVRILDGEKEEA